MDNLNKRSIVRILSGKYKGYVGAFLHYTENHHLSSKRRCAIRINTGYSPRTLLINQKNLEVTRA